MSHNIYFSIDDVILSFKSLMEHKNFDRIPAVELADWLWKQYEIPTSFFCFMNGYGIQLQSVPDDYAADFQKRKRYLKLGFHSIDADTDYSICNKERATYDYEKVINELLRITGDNEVLISRKIRVHNYHASNEAIIGFRDAKCGIEELLTADDNRISYDLDESDMSSINELGIYKNHENGLVYKKTDIRSEKYSIEQIISATKRKLLSDIEIFTHEWALTDENIEKLKMALAYISME